jgi:hypothetical protein
MTAELPMPDSIDPETPQTAKLMTRRKRSTLATQDWAALRNEFSMSVSGGSIRFLLFLGQGNSADKSLCRLLYDPNLIVTGSHMAFNCARKKLGEQNDTRHSPACGGKLEDERHVGFIGAASFDHPHHGRSAGS